VYWTPIRNLNVLFRDVRFDLGLLGQGQIGSSTSISKSTHFTAYMCIVLYLYRKSYGRIQMVVSDLTLTYWVKVKLAIYAYISLEIISLANKYVLDTYRNLIVLFRDVRFDLGLLGQGQIGSSTFILKSTHFTLL
jgi:hypothetical protein